VGGGGEGQVKKRKQSIAKLEQRNEALWETLNDLVFAVDNLNFGRLDYQEQHTLSNCLTKAHTTLVENEHGEFEK
jgi:hypothetical protein